MINTGRYAWGDLFDFIKDTSLGKVEILEQKNIVSNIPETVKEAVMRIKIGGPYTGGNNINFK